MDLKVREIRMKQGITLRQLAKLSGISTTQLQAIETGSADPRLSTLLKLAKALQVTIGDFL